MPTNRVARFLEIPDDPDAEFVRWWDATFAAAPCYADVQLKTFAWMGWDARRRQENGDPNG